MKENKKEKIVADPNGMYTGRPIDPDDRPIQDADDLQYCTGAAAPKAPSDEGAGSA